MKVFLFQIFFLFISSLVFSQTGVGLGLYPTGTEAGIGFRSAKETRWALDARLARAGLYSDKAKPSSCVSEVSLICRIVMQEKLRFHLGFGFRGDWSLYSKSMPGAVIPIGVEAFPFPFQNAGLFFEIAPFYVSDFEKDYYSGLRTAAGIVFYFQSRKKQDQQ